MPCAASVAAFSTAALTPCSLLGETAAAFLAPLDTGGCERHHSYRQGWGEERIEQDAGMTDAPLFVRRFTLSLLPRLDVIVVANSVQT